MPVVVLNAHMYNMGGHTFDLLMHDRLVDKDMLEGFRVCN